MRASDESGYPLDPTVWELEDRLGELAAEWRAAAGDAPRQARIVQAYHGALEQLSTAGWDGALDFEAYLPDELMPVAYLRRVRQPARATTGA